MTTHLSLKAHLKSDREEGRCGHRPFERIWHLRKVGEGFPSAIAWVLLSLRLACQLFQIFSQPSDLLLIVFGEAATGSLVCDKPESYAEYGPQARDVASLLVSTVDTLAIPCQESSLSLC